VRQVFIKKVVCSPNELTQMDYIKMSDILDDSERCHICIIAMEAKKQLELIYLAKAIKEFK
jgi:sestrin